jgi:hypothetical protein
MGRESGRVCAASAAFSTIETDWRALLALVVSVVGMRGLLSAADRTSETGDYGV